METSDRLESFSNDWGDRDDPDDHMETRLRKLWYCVGGEWKRILSFNSVDNVIYPS